MDALVIPVFVLVSLAVPVLLLALLLYAIPVRAAVTVVRRGGRQDQVLLISWGIFGIRTSGTGEGRLTEVLIAGHAVLAHTRSVEEDRSGVKETGTKRGESGNVPAGERRPGKAEKEPRSSAAPGSAAPDTTVPVTGDTTAGGPAAGIPATGRPETVFMDIDEFVHVVQKVMGPVGSFGSAFWQQSRFVDARGTVRLGLGDPVLTGEVCGMYWASRFILFASRIYIELEPVFNKAVLELDITVRLKVKHPLLVLLAGIRLARYPAIREAAGIAMQRSRGAAPA
jgi:hypothetical protein